MSDWKERARQMKADEPALSTGAIARELGQSYPQVWKALNHEKYTESMRKTNARRHQAKLKWADEHDRKPCPECGERMTTGAHRRKVDALCRKCWERKERARRDEKWQRVCDLWNEGKSFNEVMEAMGWTKGYLSGEMFRMRAEGWNLPYRYNVQNKKRVAA